MTMLVVLVLLSVMLLGGMAMSRFTEVGTLVAGNVAFKDRALQASSVGVQSAFLAVQALADEESNSGTWYYATAQAQNADGLPSNVNWDNVSPEVTVGAWRVRYVVERLCDGAVPVTELERQCLLKRSDKVKSEQFNEDKPDPLTGRQFRITVRVNGPKDTRTFVQTLMTRGNGLSSSSGG